MPDQRKVCKECDERPRLDGWARCEECQAVFVEHTVALFKFGMPVPTAGQALRVLIAAGLIEDTPELRADEARGEQMIHDAWLDASERAERN